MNYIKISTTPAEDPLAFIFPGSEIYMNKPNMQILFGDTVTRQMVQEANGKT
jgi:hypothetical protein